jgi:hypothetical protein
MKTEFKTGERVFYLDQPAIVRDAPGAPDDDYYVIKFDTGRWTPDAMVHRDEVHNYLRPRNDVDIDVQLAGRGISTELVQIIKRLEEIGDEWASEWGLRAVEQKIQEALAPLCSAADAAAQYASGVLEPRDD